MKEKKLFNKNLLINNNSFSKPKIKEISDYYTPIRNIKFNDSLIELKTRKKEKNKPYLLTEFKSNQNNNNININTNNNSNYITKDFFYSKNNQKQKLLKKNKTFLESPFSFIIFSSKNINDKNNMKKIYDSNLNKDNKIKNSKLHINNINLSNSKTYYLKRNNTNFSSKMTQTSSVSFYNSKNNSKDNHKENAKKFEFNKENNKTQNNINLNKIKYIDLYINQLMSKEYEIKRKKIEIFLDKKYRNINKEISQNIIINSDNKNSKKIFNDNNDINKNIVHVKKEKNKDIKNFNINYVNFKDRLDNLYHKIKVVENNEEFEDLVMSLTDEELNYILNNMNKNILPLLITNRVKKFINKENKLLNSGIKQSNSYEEKKIYLTGEENKKEDNIIRINQTPNKFNNNNIYNYKKFPKIINNNKIIHNDNTNKDNNNININNINKNELNKNNTYTKIKIKEKQSKNKKDSSLYDDIKEDLSFLGNYNKLNWDLISDKDKKRGLILWKKILNSNKIIKKLKRKKKKIRSLKIIKNVKRDNFVLELSDNDGKNNKLNKSNIIESNKYIRENNERKRKFSLNLSLSFKNEEIEDNDSILDDDINRKNLKYFNHFNIKNNIYKYRKNSKKKNNKMKNKKNNKSPKKNNNENVEDDYKDDDEEDNSIETFLKQNGFTNIINNRLMLRRLKTNFYPAGIKKDFYFNNYNVSSNRNKKKGNASTNSKLEKNMINLTKFLLEKYKVSDMGKYSSINSNILKGLNNTYNNDKEGNKKEGKQNQNQKKDKFNNNKEDEKVIIIDFFGLNIEVKNVKNALQNYMKKNNITLVQLYRQIEIKNKLSKLIKQLEKEKKERRRKRYKSKKNVLNSKIDRNLMKFLENPEKDEKIEKNGKNGKNVQKEKNTIELKKEEEKRKMRLLLKFKNDIDYKIMKGEINELDIDIFSKLKEKLDKLIDEYNIEEDNKKIEDYFGDVQEELEIIEQRKRNEKRINEFINDLNDQINIKTLTRKKIEEKFCNVINYNSVNHMNILNNV